MTGRARGRSRGRGRTEAPPPGAETARRPGEAPAARPAEAPVGRGRSRGPPTNAAPPPRAVAAAAAALPTAAMQQMSVSEPSSHEQAARGPSRVGRFSEPVTRPAGLDKRGGAGGPITLVSNCFFLETRPNYTIYQYNVSFSPEVDSKKVKLGLVAGLEDTLGRVRAFDGMAMFLPIRLPEPVTRIMATRRRRDNPDGEPVEICITLTNELPQDSPSVLHLFNIILRRMLKMIDMSQVGRQYYFTQNAIPITKHRLEVWPGYSTSILVHEKGVLLGCDVSHKVLRTETVLDYLYSLYNPSKNANFHDIAHKKLVGEIVLTRYNNKTYRIDDISWDERPHMTFDTPRGPISYVDYYAKHYEKQVSDMDQPLLIHKPKKVPGKKHIEQIKLLPEFCFLTGLSEEMRQDFSIMKDLAVHTRVSPTDRGKSLQAFINSITGHAQASAELDGWGLKFQKSLLSFPGRVLPAETIFQKQVKSSYDPKSADWSRETRGNHLHSTVPLRNWIVVHTQRDGNIAQDYVATMQRVLGPMGIQSDKPRMCAVENDRTETYLNAIKREVERDMPQIVNVIVTSNRKDRYDAIKKLCCLERPVPSQVVVSRTLSKKQMLMSVCTKIGIQLNCKLGGEAWALEIPLKNLMVVGIDCYHDSSSKGRSVGGFVASMNQTLTRYYSRCTFQMNHTELIDGLRVCMTAALRKYQEINSILPDRIIIYRDGVGDGQLNHVVEHEVSQLIESFKGIQEGTEYKPKFGMVIVKKRIQNRLFMQNPRQRELSNPPPGTVCDTDITRPEWYDFFLVSQSVRQGTVTPTHFNVIYDTTGLKPDHFQRLSYKLTHLYYNWPGTVRVPAPCQYAHKLAFLVGQSLHKEPHKDLSEKLFFL